MATITANPITDIYKRFVNECVADSIITSDNISFGKSDVGARLPWVAFKPMTNYTWLQARDLSNNENGIIVNVQVECFATKESVAMQLEDDTKRIMFNMGFYSVGFAQRFKNNEVHRYIARYDLRYTGELPNLSETRPQTGTQTEGVTNHT